MISLFIKLFRKTNKVDKKNHSEFWSYEARYYKKEGAIEYIRELFRKGTSIVEIIQTIESEKLYTSNKKARYRNITEEFDNMREDDKNFTDRFECLGLFLKECFAISPVAAMQICANIHYNSIVSNFRSIEVQVNYLIQLIEENRHKWDK